MKYFELYTGIAIGIIIIILIIYIKRASYRYKLRQRFKHGLEEELKAKRFLEKNGYEIIAYQQELCYNLYLNGEPHEIKLRPDYIVKKSGKKYIAEVKTGSYAVNISSRGTRRQILEYYYVSDYDGVILVDMDNKKIYNIEFETNRKEKQKTQQLLLIIVIILLLLVGIYFFRNLLLISN